MVEFFEGSIPDPARKVTRNIGGRAGRRVLNLTRSSRSYFVFSAFAVSKVVNCLAGSAGKTVDYQFVAGNVLDSL